MCAENALMLCESQITELYTLFGVKAGKLLEQNVKKKVSKKLACKYRHLSVISH